VIFPRKHRSVRFKKKPTSFPIVKLQMKEAIATSTYYATVALAPTSIAVNIFL
jgi:hypothetical protein